MCSEGITGFCGGPPKESPKLLDRLLDALGTWLNLPALGRIVKDLKAGGVEAAKSVGNALLEVVGLDWGSILGLVVQELGGAGQKALSMLGQFASLVYDAVTSGDLAGWLETKAKELLSKGEGFVKGLWQQLKDGWKNLIPSLIAPALLNLLSYFVPGAAWIKGLYNAIDFVVTQASKIGSLFTTLKEAVQSAISGGADVVAKIGEQVSSLIQQSLPVVMQGLADLLGLGSIPEKLGKVIGEVRTTVQKPLKELLRAILAPVRQVADAVFAKFSGRNIIGSPVTGKDGHTKAWVEKEANGKYQVWIESSPKRKPQTNEEQKAADKAVEAAPKVEAGQQQLAALGSGAAAEPIKQAGLAVRKEDDALREVTDAAMAGNAADIPEKALRETKIYPDGSVRTPDGKFAGKTGVVPGTPGVQQAEAALNNRPGWRVVGREISVRDANGTLRRYDLVAQNPAREYVGIEVKSGTATRTAQQRAVDANLKAVGGLDTVGERAANAGIDKISSVEVINTP